MSLSTINRLVLSLVRKQPVCSSVRLYSRWMHRNPAKVLLPFEPKSKVDLKKEKIIDLDPQILNKSQQNHLDTKDKVDLTKNKIIPVNSNDIKQKREDKLKKRKFYLSQKKVFDDNNDIIYEKLKENDGRINSLFVKLKAKKERIRSDQILVEGWRLIIDGLEAKCPLRYVIFSRIEDLNNLRPFLPKTGVTIYKIPYKQIELWSDVETSPGIFGVFETPKPENVKMLSRPLPLRFICDNIRIPGNLGAILRTAVGAGCEKVLLTKGCVDLWDPKVVRSAAGAHFRLPIYHSVEWEDIHKHFDEHSSIFIADSNTDVMLDNDLENEKNVKGMQIPVLPYYSIEYSTLKSINLIIGGETEGISENSYRLTASKNGLRLNIPLQRGVDSLNTGMATAIIAFEIRKQFIKAWTQAKLEKQMAQAT